ncbi:hypothetical protein [Paraburkholderia bannensis]|uniref:hypothetical protein n=1 Tax=Paraburkholderia bannensis TaxID=765414 RepID=UPI002AB774E2|nr:hypothetical protein [Paraburkholderia bannensis]
MGKQIQVIAEEPWDWFLLEGEGTVYLNILVEHGAVSFDVTFELSAEQATEYEHKGIGYIHALSSATRSTALRRDWSAMPVSLHLTSPGTAKGVSEAIREWQGAKLSKTK